jgi:hypothetical protein
MSLWPLRAARAVGITLTIEAAAKLLSGLA